MRQLLSKSDEWFRLMSADFVILFSFPSAWMKQHCETQICRKLKYLKQFDKLPS